MDQTSIGKTKIVPKDGPGRAGWAIDRADGRLKMRRGGALNLETWPSGGLLNQTTAAITLKAKDDGLTVLANAAATVTATLPLAKAGMRFRIIAHQLPGSGAGTTLTPNAADKFQGNGFGAKTNGQALVNSAATDVAGDMIEVLGTDANIWYVITKLGTWA